MFKYQTGLLRRAMVKHDDIDLGVVVMTHGKMAPEERLEDRPGMKFEQVARTAEEAGFDVLMAGEHITFPDGIADIYPYTETHESPFEISDPAYDGFQILAQMAGVTDSIQLATNICIAPLRHPVTLTKHALTLHAISEGRFDFGVGVGWLEDEFNVLDVSFEERGSRTDEFLEIFNRACADPEFSFDGTHFQFQKTGFHPVADADGPPLYIGGDTGAALRRTAEFADGWSHYWTREDLADSSPEAITEWRDRLLNAWNDYDRAGDPEIAVTRPIQIGENPQPPFHSELGVDRSLDEDVPLIGSPESIIEDLEAYVDVGVDRLNCSFQVSDYNIDLFIEQIERFGDEVIADL